VALDKLTPEEVNTVIYALSAYMTSHKRTAEESPFQESVEYSRAEWIRASDILLKMGPFSRK
jgi:hypothetical protein